MGVLNDCHVGSEFRLRWFDPIFWLSKNHDHRRYLVGPCSFHGHSSDHWYIEISKQDRRLEGIAKNKATSGGK